MYQPQDNALVRHSAQRQCRTDTNISLVSSVTSFWANILSVLSVETSIKFQAAGHWSQLTSETKEKSARNSGQSHQHLHGTHHLFTQLLFPSFIPVTCLPTQMTFSVSVLHAEAKTSSYTLERGRNDKRYDTHEHDTKKTTTFPSEIRGKQWASINLLPISFIGLT